MYYFNIRFYHLHNCNFGGKTAMAKIVFVCMGVRHQALIILRFHQTCVLLFQCIRIRIAVAAMMRGRLPVWLKLLWDVLCFTAMGQHFQLVLICYAANPFSLLKTILTLSVGQWHHLSLERTIPNDVHYFSVTLGNVSIKNRWFIHHMQWMYYDVAIQLQVPFVMISLIY